MFTHSGLDTFVAHELSKFTACDAPDLSSEFEQVDQWLQTFILSLVFHDHVNTKVVPYVFAIVRRAQTAIAEYETARAAAGEYLRSARRTTLYFRALSHFELSVAVTHQAYEFYFKMTGARMYEKGDGTPLQRLARVSDVSKHLEFSTIPQGHLHHVWLTNEGIKTSTATITWEELRQLIHGISLVAETLADSNKLAEARAKYEAEKKK